MIINHERMKTKRQNGKVLDISLNIRVSTITWKDLKNIRCERSQTQREFIVCFHLHETLLQNGQNEPQVIKIRSVFASRGRGSTGNVT